MSERTKNSVIPFLKLFSLSKYVRPLRLKGRVEVKGEKFRRNWNPSPKLELRDTPLLLLKKSWKK